MKKNYQHLLMKRPASNPEDLYFYKEESMQPEQARDFDKEAAQWDQNPGRVKLARDVADAIMKTVSLERSMNVLDFGCGTGLVTLQLQPFVRAITGADSSKGMLGALNEKIKQRKLSNVRTLFVDFEKGQLVSGTYDLIVSSMTLHHVPDAGLLFKQWYELLKPGGRVCFADLDTEDGTFHPDSAGVFHLGFDRDKLVQLLRQTGFIDVRPGTATKIVKDVEGLGTREFSVFLISANK
jgi:ubiquinone/menaquinone biosynthesis C-methylase UbiE